MSELLSNYLSGRWTNGQSAGTALVDPVLGEELARVDASGLDRAAGFDTAKRRGWARTRRSSPNICWCRLVHKVEVFGGVATLLPYRDRAHLPALVRRGQGSLVVSVFGSDPAELGGLRASNFYHRRAAVQASTTVLWALELGQA
jgi:hypothetical protein